MSHPQAGEPIAPTSDSLPGRKTRRRIDWRLGARLLAEGKPPGEAAAALGIEATRFWRHLETSSAFQQQILAAIRQQNALAKILNDARLNDARGRTARVQAAEKMLARMERGAHPDKAT